MSAALPAFSLPGTGMPFIAPGPVAAAFMISDAPIRGIMGPVGSGKTRACLMELVYRTWRQPRSPIDGIRRARFAVIRDTYRQLHRTTIPSWNQLFPQTVGNWTGGKNEPATHALRLHLGEETLDLVVEFQAIGEHSIEDITRGWEVTGAYINEADRLADNVLYEVYGRLGRYPPPQHGGPGWCGVWCDFNAPDLDSWLYHDMVEDRHESVRFFRQPSAFHPDAENMRTRNRLLGLAPDYYEKLSVGQKKWWVDRYLHCKFGYSREGKPVYEDEFRDEVHVAPHDLDPVPDRRLVIGADAGGFPAAIIQQRMPNGQIRWLDELGEHGMGPSRFGDELARLLQERYPELDAVGICDPSAAYGGDKEGDDQAWIEIVSSRSGIRFEPAPTNDTVPRIEALRSPLGRMIDGAPGFLLSPRCRMARRGLNASYRYRRRIGTGGSHTESPEKNDASHFIEAGQYACLGDGEHDRIMRRTGMTPRMPMRARVPTQLLGARR